jgi:UDP-N-acetylglucosamine 1-carboxyvinyltransferase
VRYLKIIGNKKMKGEIDIQGAKNSILVIVVVALLTQHSITIKNVVKISDLNNMLNLLNQCGVDTSFVENSTNNSSLDLVIEKRSQSTNKLNLENPIHPDYDINKALVQEINNFFSDEDKNDLVVFSDNAKEVRTSLMLWGALFANGTNFVIRQPGGCNLGDRKFDMHIDALGKMGAVLEEKNICGKGYLFGKIKKNQSNISADDSDSRLNAIDYTFRQISVTGSANIMVAACLAKGTTTLHNIALEPELTDLIELLNKMGADIKFIGERSISIEGKDDLFGAEHEILKDRIEAGTYMIAGAAIGEELKINIAPWLVKSTTEVLRNVGATIIEYDDYIVINAADNLNPIEVSTGAYPQFSTDLQPQLTVLLSIANGKSKIIENMFNNRVCHLPELNKMNANVSCCVEKKNIYVEGVKSLSGTHVNSYALRGAAAMVLAGLFSNGETKVYDIDKLYRGYYGIVSKLVKCGLDVEELETSAPEIIGEMQNLSLDKNIQEDCESNQSYEEDMPSAIGILCEERSMVISKA